MVLESNVVLQLVPTPRKTIYKLGPESNAIVYVAIRALRVRLMVRIKDKI
jgi:hypothetical protein